MDLEDRNESGFENGMWGEPVSIASQNRRAVDNDLKLERAHTLYKAIKEAVVDIDKIRLVNESNPSMMQKLVAGINGFLKKFGIKLLDVHGGYDLGVEFRPDDDVLSIRRLISESCDLIVNHIECPEQKTQAEQFKPIMLGYLPEILAATRKFSVVDYVPGMEVEVGKLYKIELEWQGPLPTKVIGVCKGFSPGDNGERVPYFEFDHNFFGVSSQFGYLAKQGRSIQGFTATADVIY